MNFHTVLDISSIIWDRDDYNANKHQYYGLMNSALKLLDKLKKEQPKILVREELLSELIGNFPFDEVPDNFYEFGISVYDFLGAVGSNVVTYPDNVIPDIVSIPNLVKSHYNASTQDEVYYLISAIHTDDETDNVYFTFQYLWGENEGKLKTQVEEDIKEHETVICDKGTELKDFFDKLKPVFKHNPKHDKTPYNDRVAWEKAENKDSFPSRLSCYNGIDNDRPQELLDDAQKYGYRYYNYDDENETWVTFQPDGKRTDNRDYHGYDEYDSDRIPNELRKHFNR